MNKFNRITTPLVITLLACFVLVGCSKKSDTTWQGYLEGEFVYVATPLGGRLDHLAVS